MSDATYNLNGGFKPTMKRFADLDGPDFFPTPRWATFALIENEKFNGEIWECACGDGTMSRVLEGANRAKTIFANTPPSRVWVFSERITFYPSGVEPKGSGTSAYAWFVWDKDAPGSTELKWFEPGYKARFG
jgi:hypothetical protein